MLPHPAAADKDPFILIERRLWMVSVFLAFLLSVFQFRRTDPTTTKV